MTDIRERLTPRKQPRTPEQHYYAADELMSELEALHPHELNLPYAKGKLALADIHARLAQCVLPDVVDLDLYPPPQPPSKGSALR